MQGMDEVQRIDIHTHLERFESYEELGKTLGELVIKAGSEGRKILSVSHAVDRADPDGKPYSFVLISETR